MSRAPLLRQNDCVGRHSTEQGTDLDEDVEVDSLLGLGRPWSLVIWNDPVNLMSYVSWIFRSYFGYDDDEADRLMLTVHTEGRAVVAAGTREEMERHALAMHAFGLWATLQQPEA